MTHEHWHRTNAHVSRAFSLEELASALGARSARSDCNGPAHALAAAALAPHVWARDALLALCGSGDALRLVLERAPSALERLRVWPDERLLAVARVPYLTLHNIRGKNEYVCHECGARFDQPNPLKAHLYLRCAAPRPRAFWRALLAALRAPRDPPEPPAVTNRAHPIQRAHLCLYCGKAYSRKYGLKIHIRTHTGHRPLRCRYCARAFADPSNLNKHVRLHEHAK